MLKIKLYTGETLEFPSEGSAYAELKEMTFKEANNNMWFEVDGRYLIQSGFVAYIERSEDNDR